MINLCNVCNKVLDEGDVVEMMIEGMYHSVPSAKSFALYKNMKFRTGTIAHIDCDNPKEPDDE